MIPVKGIISTDFFEPRPLSKRLEDRDHCHGAIDIAASMGTKIYMPEAGKVWKWAAFRYNPGEVWPNMPKLVDHMNPFCNYFYDTFGGVIVCVSEDRKRTHIIAHEFCNTLFNRFDQQVFTVEEKKKTRWAIHGLFTEPKHENEGAVIGYVGDAGFSTGPHIHWEIHKGSMWNRWEDRINPARWEG